MVWQFWGRAAGRPGLGFGTLFISVLRPQRQASGQTARFRWQSCQLTPPNCHVPVATFNLQSQDRLAFWNVDLPAGDGPYGHVGS